MRPEQVRYEEELAETAPAAQHAVHSQRLQQIMRGLDGLSRDRLPREIDMQRELERQRKEVGAMALALSKSAALIPDVLSEVELTPEQSQEFRRLAADLERRSLALAEQAPALSAAAIQERLDGITASCDTCHRRFRVLPAAPPL